MDELIENLQITRKRIRFLKEQVEFLMRTRSHVGYLKEAVNNLDEAMDGLLFAEENIGRNVKESREKMG